MTGILRKWWFWGLVGLLIAAAGITYWLWPRTYELTVSRETTVLLGPLNPDGTVNYVAAMNQMYGEGVTPENNAAVLLIQAAGPDMFRGGRPRGVLKELGIEALPKSGNYFVHLGKFVSGLQPREPTTSEGIKELRERAHMELRKAIRGPWSGDDYPMIAKWLQANAKPLSLVVAASRRPRYHFPFISDSDPPILGDVVHPNVGAYREMVRALAARAMLNAGEGRIEEAVADVLACHRLGRLLGQGARLLDKLLGLLGAERASKHSAALATSRKLTAAQAKRFFAKLDALAAIPDVVDAVDNSERFFVLDLVGTQARGSWTGRHRHDDFKINVDWDKLLRKLNYWYDMQVAAMRKPTFAERAAAAASFESAITKHIDTLTRQAKWRLWKGDPGDALFMVAICSYTKQCMSQDIIIMRLRLAKLAVALAACKAEKGRYPEKLSDLEPEYFKKLPQDLFAEGPLTYRRVGKGYLLYSVGENMKDDGGQEDEAKEFDDIAVRAE